MLPRKLKPLGLVRGKLDVDLECVSPVMLSTVEDVEIKDNIPIFSKHGLLSRTI